MSRLSALPSLMVHLQATRWRPFIPMFAVCLLLDWARYLFPYMGASITSWSPLTGFSLFFLLRWGNWAVVPILAARVAGNLLIRGHSAVLPSVVWSDIVLVASFALTATLLKRQLTLNSLVPNIKNVAVFIMAGIAATLAVSLIYVTVLAVSDQIEWENFLGTWQRRFLGDLLGLLTVVPVLQTVLNYREAPPEARLRPRLEHLMQAAFVAIAAAIIFGVPFIDEFKFFYLLFIPVIWTSVKDGLPGASFAILVTQITLFVTIRAVGGDQSNASLAAVQLLMATLTITGLLLGTVVSERRRAETALRDSEQRVQIMFEVIPDAMIAVRRNGTIESINSAAVRLFDLPMSAAAGLRLDMLFPTLDLNSSPSQQTVETVARRSTGEFFPVEIMIDQTMLDGAPLLVLMARDVTERKDMEIRLAQKQTELSLVTRRSVTGELAAVMAHEINQPLTAMVNYVGACQAIIDEKQPTMLLAETLGKVAQQANRAGEIIRRLRRFLGRGDKLPTIEAIGPVIDEALELMASDFRNAGITPHVEIASDLPPVLIDRIQIQQVLHNLIRNGMEAMTDVEPAWRRIVISADRGCAGDVIVRILDAGPGISERVSPTLFQPFETTKPNGMGLGLSISRSIIEAHSGRMWHEEAPGGGAVFCFTMPIATDQSSIRGGRA